MSATASPSGFVPAFHGSGPNVAAIAHTGVLLAGTNVNIFKYQPVRFTIGTGGAVNGVTVPAGQVVLSPVVANNVAIYGVFAGCEYTDTTGAPIESDYWPASTQVFTGSAVTAWIYEDPEIVYTAQTDGALPVIVAAGTPFAQFDARETNVSNFTNGSTATGLSAATLSATPVATTVQGQFQIVKLDPTIYNQNNTSDAFVQLQVTIANSQVAAPNASI